MELCVVGRLTGNHSILPSLLDSDLRPTPTPCQREIKRMRHRRRSGDRDQKIQQRKISRRHRSALGQLDRAGGPIQGLGKSGDPNRDFFTSWTQYC